MLRDEIDYDAAVARLDDQRIQLINKREQLRFQGLADDEIEQRIDDLNSDCRRLEEAIATYERRTARTWVPV